MHFSVTGMTCQKGCASKIQRCLNELPGVSSASVDFPARTAAVSTTVSSLLTVQDVMSCIQTSGPAGKFDCSEQPAVSTGTTTTTTKTTTTATSTTTTKEAFLITSPGFGTQLSLNLAAMACTAAVCAHVPALNALLESVYFFITLQMMHAANHMAWWSLLGLLSSSCCALQIILNSLSFGCAGFNTALGPYRPFFVALTIAVQTVSWCVAFPRRWQWPPTAAATALSLFLTFLPELLAWRAARRERLSASEGVAGTVAEDDLGAGRKSFRLQVPSIGCAACVDKVSKVLSGLPAASRVAVRLADGVATVNAACEMAEILQRLEDAGFPASDSEELQLTRSTKETKLD